MAIKSRSSAASFTTRGSRNAFEDGAAFACGRGGFFAGFAPELEWPGMENGHPFAARRWSAKSSIYIITLQEWERKRSRGSRRVTLCTKDKKVFEFFIWYFEVAKAFAVAGCDVTQGKGAVVADVQAAVSMTSRLDSTITRLLSASARRRMTSLSFVTSVICM